LKKKEGMRVDYGRRRRHYWEFLGDVGFSGGGFDRLMTLIDSAGRGFYEDHKTLLKNAWAGDDRHNNQPLSLGQELRPLDSDSLAGDGGEIGLNAAVRRT